MAFLKFGKFGCAILGAVSEWILTNSVWNDSGVWDDNENWSD